MHIARYWYPYYCSLRCLSFLYRLHFASTETATDWSGYMDGAIQSGWRSAVEILLKMGIPFQNPEEEVEEAEPILNLSPSLCEKLLERAIATVKEE